MATTRGQIPKTTTGKGANYRPTKSGAGMTKKVWLHTDALTLVVN